MNSVDPLTLCPVLVCLLANWRAGAPSGVAGKDVLAGLALGLLLAGGLALSARFFAGRTARVCGGLAFAALLAVGGAGIGLAGCIPVPDLRTVEVRRAAAVPSAAKSNHAKASPAPAQPQATPHKVVELRFLPYN